MEVYGSFFSYCSFNFLYTCRCNGRQAALWSDPLTKEAFTTVYGADSTCNWCIWSEVVVSQLVLNNVVFTYDLPSFIQPRHRCYRIRQTVVVSFLKLTIPPFLQINVTSQLSSIFQPLSAGCLTQCCKCISQTGIVISESLFDEQSQYSLISIMSKLIYLNSRIHVT